MGLFNLAAEADEQDNLDTEQSIPDEDGATAPKQDDASAAPPTDATDNPDDEGALPTDANPTPGEGTPNADDPADDSTGEDNEDEEDDGTVEIPDTSELAVTKVSEAVDAISDEEAQALQNGTEPDVSEAQRQVVVDDAVEAAEDTAEALEAFQTSLEQRGYIDDTAARLGALVLRRVRGRVGLRQHQGAMALESQASKLREGSKLDAALESFTDTLTQIWKQIIAGLKMAYNWLVAKIKAFFDINQRVKKGTQDLAAQIIQQRKKHKDLIGDGALNFNRQQYVVDDGNPLTGQVMGWLNIGGRIPTDGPNVGLAPHLEEIQSRVEQFTATFEFFSQPQYQKNFILAAEKLCGLAKDDAPAVDAADILFDPFDRFANADMKLAGDKFGNLSAKPDTQLMVSLPMLSNRQLLVQLPTSLSTSNPLEIMFESLSKCDFMFLTPAPDQMPGANGGALPYLSDDVISRTTQVMTNLLNAVDKYKAKENQYREMEKGLISLAERCAAADKTKADPKTITLIAGAISNLAKMLNSAVAQQFGYAGNVALHYQRYLALIYKKESEIVKQGGATSSPAPEPKPGKDGKKR